MAMIAVPQFPLQDAHNYGANESSILHHARFTVGIKSRVIVWQVERSLFRMALFNRLKESIS